MMQRPQKLFQIVLPLLLACVLVGCGSEDEPTPTPTKTPMTAAEAVQPTATLAPAESGQTGGQPAEQPAAQPTPEPTKIETIGTVTADLLNIRSEPSTEGELVTTATIGQKFTVVGRNQDGTWLQVADNGKLLGWVAAEFLEVAQVAVAPSNPTTGEPAATGDGSEDSHIPTPVPAASSFQPATMLSPDFGAQAFLWWRPEVAERDVQLMREAGFNWVKQSFAWETIEGKARGEFDWSISDRVVAQVNNSGLKLLARLSTDPELPAFWAGPPPGNGDLFAEYAAALAARYNCQPGAKGCIQAFQIWNEPNLAREWGGRRPNPAEYVAFLGKAYTAIKQANPNAIVISAGMAPTGDNSDIAMPDDLFYEEMYKAMGGNSNCCFDMLGVHGAGFAAPPELDPAEAASNPKYGGYRFFAFRHVEDIRAIMVRYGDTNKKIVLLEFGWTFDSVNAAYKWHGADAGIDQFVQGNYLRASYEYAATNWSSWIGLMNLLTMPNIDWTADGNPNDEEQYWWAIMEPSPVNTLNFRAAFIILCDYFNRQRGQFCPYDPARQ